MHTFFLKEATMDNGEDGISVEITPDISGMQLFLLTQPIIGKLDKEKST